MGDFFDRLFDRLDGLGRRAARSFGGGSEDLLDRLTDGSDRTGRETEVADARLGARFGREAAPIEAAACPSCGDALSALGIDDTAEVFECGRGCGFFASATAVKKLERDDAYRAALRAAVGEAGPLPDATTVQYRRCPACRAWTQRLNYMRVSGVMVDFCLKHGVWCDAGELPAMIAFIDGGGAERGAQFERDNRDYVRRVRASIPDDDAGF